MWKCGVLNLKILKNGKQNYPNVYLYHRKMIIKWVMSCHQSSCHHVIMPSCHHAIMSCHVMSCHVSVILCSPLVMFIHLMFMYSPHFPSNTIKNHVLLRDVIPHRLEKVHTVQVRFMIGCCLIICRVLIMCWLCMASWMCCMIIHSWSYSFLSSSKSIWTR